MATPIFRPVERGTTSASGYFRGDQRLSHSSYNSIVPTTRSLRNHVERILHPQGPFWNWILLAVCIISISSDPLFFYIFVVNDHKNCVGLDPKLAYTVIVLRTVFDTFYIICSTFNPTIFLFIHGRQILHGHDRAKARNIIQDFFSCVPAPQVVTIVIVLTRRGSNFFSAVVFLKGFVIVQYFPRFNRIYRVYTEAERNSGILAQLKWVKASFCILIYLLWAHVYGALWYLMAIERVTDCWKKACIDHTGCRQSSFCCYDGNGDYTFLDGFCVTMKQDTKMYNFGIFYDALQSGIVKETGSMKKFLYCFRWGLQTISSLGQNLQTSTYEGENFLTCFIIISSLLLLLLVLGTMQIFFQYGTVRSEEMRFRAREIEDWTTFRMLSQNLQQRVRIHQQFVWQETRGVDVENLLNNLPRNLSKDIKSELCLQMLKKVPMFQRMEEQLLYAICNSLKPVLYAEAYYIVKEGEPISEMLFMMQGTVSTTTSNGGATCFFKDYLKHGDFWGEELPAYVLDPMLLTLSLPRSTCTVSTVTTVEVFALTADDLREVVYEFWRVQRMPLPHLYRFYSPKWRTLKARAIQRAWRRYKRMKLGNVLHDDELTEAGENLSTLSVTFYVALFCTTALRALRRKGILN